MRPELISGTSGQIGKSTLSSRFSKSIRTSINQSPFAIEMIDELGYWSIEPFNVGAHDLLGPIPPGDPQEALYDRTAEPISHKASRITRDNGIRRNKPKNNGTIANHRTVLDSHAATDVRLIADPDITADFDAPC